jgi:hypothetical protein
MVEQLIAETVQAARMAALEVRAPALLHASRVLTTQDRAEADRVFNEALALMPNLDPRSMRCFGDRVLLIAAAAQPSRFRELVKAYPPLPMLHGMDHVLQTMVDHGHVRAAAEYLAQPVNTDDYPYGTVPLILQQYAEDQQQSLDIMRSAAAAWRRSPVYDFFRLFAAQWKILPPEEARGILQELLAFVAAQPDRSIHARIGMDVEFTSEQDFRRFELLPVLGRLEPETVRSLSESRPQFAKGVARFPLGLESVMTERRPAPAPAGGARGYVMAGNPKDFPMMHRLMEAERAGELGPFFEHALRLYAEDSDPDNPNLVPRECWPSTQQFRRAFDLAGRVRGETAVELFDRVPDGDLLLFSQIALAAALRGLPELRLSQSTSRPHR